MIFHFAVIKHTYASIYRLELEEKFAKAMAKSGMAITITSVTDLFVFGIGSSSDLPIMSGFSLYAAVGIFSVYMYMTSFFLAWFSLDQRRIADRRDGCFCCFKWESCLAWRSTNSITGSMMESIFAIYARVLVKPWAKIVVLSSSIAIIALSTFEATQLETHFDNTAFLPNESPFTQYALNNLRYFPSEGCGGILYVTNASDTSKLEKINDMLNAVEENGEITFINSFVPYFVAYLQLVSNLYYCVVWYCTIVSINVVTHCTNPSLMFCRRLRLLSMG